MHRTIRAAVAASSLLVVQGDILASGDGIPFRTLLLSGGQASGAEAGVTVGRIFGVALNDFGEAVLSADLVPVGGEAVTLNAVYSVAATSETTLIAQTGDQVPGLQDGVQHSRLSMPRLNNAGDFLFGSLISGPWIDFGSNRAIVADVGGEGLSVVAQTGSEAPGLQAGVTFTRLGFATLNELGEIAFLGDVFGIQETRSGGPAGASGRGGVGESGQAIFTSRGASGLSPIAVTGDPAPGFEGKVIYRSFIGSEPVLNAAGDMAFFAQVEGSGIDEGVRNVVFRDLEGSGLQPLV